jgi:hypothetical protein
MAMIAMTRTALLSERELGFFIGSPSAQLDHAGY